MFNGLVDRLILPAALALVIIGLVTMVVGWALPMDLWVAGALSGALVWVCSYRYFHARNLDEAKLFGSRREGVCSAGIARGIFLQAAAIFLPALAWVLVVGFDFQLPKTAPRDFLSAVLLTMVLPVQEEVVFRGLLLFGMISIGMSPLLATVVQAALFSSIHGLAFSLAAVVIFINGLTWGVLALRYRLIWPVALIHLFWNGIEIFRAIAVGAFADGSATQGSHAGYPPMVSASLCLALACYSIYINRHRRCDVGS